MATDVRIGYPSFEQVFFQNEDMAASPPSDTSSSSPCESLNGNVFETLYILPEEPTVMESDTPHISNEETNEIQELYFSETEVHEAHGDVGSARAVDFGAVHTVLPNIEDGSLIIESSENVPTYGTRTQNGSIDFITSISEKREYHSYTTWTYVDSTTSSSGTSDGSISDEVRIREYQKFTSSSARNEVSQELLNPMERLNQNTFGIMEMVSEPAMQLQDTEMFVADADSRIDEVIVKTENAETSEAASYFDSIQQSPFQLPVVGEPAVNERIENDESGIAFNLDSTLNTSTVPLLPFPIIKQEQAEIVNEEYGNSELNLNWDFNCNAIADITIKEEESIIASEDNFDHVMTSRMSVVDNGCTPFNVVKEVVVDDSDGSLKDHCNTEVCLQSTTVREYCVSGTSESGNCNGSYYSIPIAEDDALLYRLVPIEEYVAYHDRHGNGDESSKFQQPSSSFTNVDEENDQLYVSSASESESDTSSVQSSGSKKRKRKYNLRKRSNGKNDGTKVTKKECKSNGRRRTSRRSEDSSSSPIMKRGVEVNSLRFHVGPRLRFLSAVLEVTGVKHMADYIPYEVMRRFHPTHTYRTILKMIETPTNKSKIPFENLFPEEPDWKELENLDEEANFETEKETQSQRIYYKSPFGHDRQGERSLGQKARSSLLSIPKELEKDGKPTYSPTVISSVGTAYLNVTLDLESLAESCTNTELQESLEMPLIIRLREPKCVGLLYETGKLVVVGTQSFDDFRKAVRRFARMVQKSNYKVRLTDLVMHSFLGLAKLPFMINVAGLAQHEKISSFTKYDLSVIPGAIMFMRSTSIMCLIFSSGAVIMTDATNEKDMKTTLDNIYPCCRLFGY